MAGDRDSLVDDTLLDGPDNDKEVVVDQTEVEDGPPKGEANDFDVEVVDDEQAPEKDDTDQGEDETTATAAPDDDLSQYGQKVRARIERERRTAREEKSRADAANLRATKAEREALESQKEALETTEAALGIQIDATKKALVKAKDDGKTEEEVDLQQKLHRLSSRQEGLAQAKESIKQREEQLKAGGQQDARPNPLATEWTQANAGWFGNPRFQSQTAIVRAIDAQLARDGWDPRTPEYFERLNREIRRRVPEVAKFMPRPKRTEGAPQKREPTGGVTRADTSAVTRGADGKRKVTLTRADLQTMREFGMDPSSKEHQLEFAKQKLIPVGGR